MGEAVAWLVIAACSFGIILTLCGVALAVTATIVAIATWTTGPAPRRQGPRM